MKSPLWGNRSQHYQVAILDLLLDLTAALENLLWRLYLMPK